MIHFKPIEHHIRNRAQSRLCDGRPASDADISSEDWSALREARRDATLCPDCQDKVNPRDVRSELYGMGRHSTAHLYAVPVLAAFDAIRNCPHYRRYTDDNCNAWREAREAVATLTREARRIAKGVDEPRAATSGCTATLRHFACGSVAYFTPDAPDFQEAGELKGDDLAKAVRILNGSGVPGGNPVKLERNRSMKSPAAYFRWAFRVVILQMVFGPFPLYRVNLFCQQESLSCGSGSTRRSPRK